MPYIEYEGRSIEVIEIEQSEWDFILYKSTSSDDYYLVILLNHSFVYYDKVAKVKKEDIQSYFKNKLILKDLVNNYRG